MLRDVIDAGRYPGPRIKAASPEIVSSGGLGDERMWHMHQESVGYIADGPDEVRKACRLCVREGVDNLKINISGDEFAHPGQSEKITYFDAEVAAAAEVAREAGVQHHHPRQGGQGGAARAQARHQHHLPCRLRDR